MWHCPQNYGICNQVCIVGYKWHWDGSMDANIYQWRRFEFQGVYCDRMIEWCSKLSVCIDTVSNPCDIALKMIRSATRYVFRVWFTFGLSGDVNFVYEYTLQYLIYNDIFSKLYAIARRNDGIHSKQVWVTWCELQQDDGMTPICI